MGASIGTDIQIDLRSHLISKPELAAVVGERIYQDFIPQTTPKNSDSDYPAIVISLVTAESDAHLNGASGLVRDRIQIDAQATKRTEANAVAELVRTAIQGFRGVMGKSFVNGVTYVSLFDNYYPPIDGSDSPLFVRAIDYEFAHQQATTVTKT